MKRKYLCFGFLLFVVVLRHDPLIAQTAESDATNRSDHSYPRVDSAPNPSSLPTPVQKDPADSWYTGFVEIFADHGPKFVLLPLLLLFGELIRRWRKQIREGAKLGLRKLRGRLKIKKTEYRYLKVCLLGRGGSGKTTMIRTFCHCPDADARAKTGDYRQIASYFEYAGPDSQRGVRIDWLDYCGQTITTLTDGVRKTLSSNPKSASNDNDLNRLPIDVLILMVGTFVPPEPGLSYNELPTIASWSRPTVTAAAEYWLDADRMAVIKSLSKKGSRLWIFVNTYDKISDLDERNYDFASRSKIIKNLRDELAGELTDVAVTLRVGSAAGSFATTELFESFLTSAKVVEPSVKKSTTEELQVAEA